MRPILTDLAIPFLRQRHGLLVSIIDQWGLEVLEFFDRYESAVVRTKHGFQIAAGGDWRRDLPAPEDPPGVRIEPIRVTLVESWNLESGGVFALSTYRYQLRAGVLVERYDRDPTKPVVLLHHCHPFGEENVRMPMMVTHPERAVSELLGRLAILADSDPDRD